MRIYPNLFGKRYIAPTNKKQSKTKNTKKITRLQTFFDPSTGNNYQSEKASEAIISGGFFGKGIGEGTL